MTGKAGARSRRGVWSERAVFLLLTYNTFVGTWTYTASLYYRLLLLWPLYIALVVLWLVSLLCEKRAFPRTFLDLPLALLGLIMLGATLCSVEPLMSLEHIPLFFTYVMVYYLVVDRLRAGWSPLLFLRSLALVTGVVCLVAVVEYAFWYFGVQGRPDVQHGWWSIGGWSRPIPPSLHRLSQTMFNANMLASLLASSLPIGAAAVLIARSKPVRIAGLAWLALSGTVLLMTFSRGGLVAAGSGLLTFAAIVVRQRGSFSWQRPRWTRSRRTALLAASVAFIILGTSVASFLYLVLSRLSTVEFRLSTWYYALRAIADHPLIGTGPQTFGAVALTYWNPVWSKIVSPITTNTAHNLFFHAGAELGLPGAVVIAIIGLLIVRVGYRHSTHPNSGQSVLRAAALSGVIAFGVHGLVENLLSVQSVVIPVIVMAAIATTEPKQDKHAPAPRLLTPRRGLLLSIAMAALAAWSLVSLAAFEGVTADAHLQQWRSAATGLDQLSNGSLPRSFYHFQQGLVRGKLALEENDASAIQEAMAHYQKGLATMPQYLPGHANLAALHWASGDLEGAQRELQAITGSAEVLRDPVLYHLNLGLLYEEEKRDVEAVAAYANALAMSPSAAASVYWQDTEWRRQHWTRILENAEAQVEQLYEDDAATVRQGQLAYFSGDLSRAMERFADGDLPVWQSRVLIEGGDAQAAIAILDEVIRTSRATAASDAYLLRGRANLMLGRDERAAGDLEMALFLGKSAAHDYLGQLALNQGDVPTATWRLRRALSTPQSLLEINSLYDLIVYRRSGIADSNLLPLTYLPPSTEVADTYLELADLYVAQGNIELARELIEQLLSFSPGYQPARDKLEALGPPS